MSANGYALLAGVSLPVCCSPQGKPDDSHCSSTFTSSRLVCAEVLRVNSLAELSYVAWKCASKWSRDASDHQEKRHSQWLPLRQVTPVRRPSPNANTALGRGPRDSKFEVDNPQVDLWQSQGEAVGRFTVARKRIRTSERAIQAAAFAVVVAQKLAPRRCHWSFQVLRKKALQCGDCEFSRYCSRECLSADAPLHDFQCSALSALKRKELSADEDVETIRLVLAVLSMEQFVGSSRVMELLTTHRRRHPSDDDKTHDTVKLIVETTGRVLGPAHVRRTVERVRCNAHPLYVDGVACVGSGVFPEAAMAVNHSCLPNVAPSFDPKTRTLAFHAIVDIPEGHAVESAYIELLQSRRRRQSLLARGFGFDCVCQRCITEASADKTTRNPEEEDEEDSEEVQVTEQLMRIMNEKTIDAKQRLERLKGNNDHVFERNDEAQFAYYTAELQLARAHNDYRWVLQSAEKLLKIWTRCGLPDNYHTTEMLHVQMHWAAKRAGMTEKARASAQRVADIRRICGYPHPETLVE